jgi:tRNA threonylcarbamoyladenosine biosynthesis protein TsaB
MTILALEFSSDRRSVAVARDGAVLAEAVQHTESRATAAFALIETVLADAKIAREEIEMIAVGLGPGSYTGIRASIALAQGWRLAREIKIWGVNSAAAMALKAQSGGNFGHVNVVIDAQRGEFYLAAWEISEAGRKELLPLQIVLPAEIAARQAAGEICLGPEQQQKVFPGAAEIARLAAGQTEASAETLEPIYLRATNFVKAPARRA